LNGVDQGATTCDKGICLWQGIHLKIGQNDLRATATIGAEQVSDTLQWNLAGSPAVMRIKVGSLTGCVSRNNERYGSDMYFHGGEGRGIDPPDGDDARLYDSVREGDFSYRIPVPNGRYRITARFIEPGASAAGDRVFDVSVNGKTALESFDVFKAAGGKLRGVARSFEGTAKDGSLDIEFKPSRGRAVLSALSITPLEQR
jgi:beta-galactosidase